MSLEGLDSAQLAEAFETAQAEPGGWFWIKYASRDEVELLTKGTKGSEEMRLAAMMEPEDSPLYGFIRFRRRSVLVKYIPEGTSRVRKARSQVHFQLVAERFSPHDTTYQISSPHQLTDAGLNSSCSTHTATASISSSNSSLRQRRLADIAESADEGDDGSTAKNFNMNSSPATDRPPEMAVHSSPPRGHHNHQNGERLAVVVTSHDGDSNSVHNGNGGQGLAEQVQSNDRDAVSAARAFLLPTKGDDDNYPNQYSQEPRRKSTSSARPSLKDDIYNYYPYIPKVKLGPRPVGAADSLRRPHTSNERSKTFNHSSAEELRAAIPKSVLLPSRKPTQPPVRSTSLAATLELPQPPASPVAPPSPSSVVSLPFFPSPPHSSESHTITPEKQRLMKALQLRRQNMITAEKKEQDTVNHSNMDATDSGSEEKTPTRATMFGNKAGYDDLQRLQVPERADGADDEEQGEEGQATPVEIKRPEVSIQVVGVTNAVEPSSSTSPEEPKKEVGSPAVEEPPQLEDEVVLEEAKVEQPSEPVVQEMEQFAEKTPEKPIMEDKQSTPVIAETPAPDEAEKSEGTKVRDDVDSESDAESARSMDVHVLEASPDITQAPPPSTPTTVPTISKTMHHADPVSRVPEHPKDTSPSPLRSLKRIDRTIEKPSPTTNEAAVTETARSVSAPFLKTARSLSRGTLPEPTLPKKVNIGGGSVSQRIKQFQQLATSTPPAFTPPSRPLTPSRSGANSPNPSMLNRSPSFNTTPPPALRRGSFNATAFERSPPAAPPAPSPPKPERSAEPVPEPRDETPKVEIVEKDNRPQLQVTTKIHHDKSRTPSPTPSAATVKHSPKIAQDAPKSATPPPEKSLRRRSIDISSVVDMITPRRSSMDQGSSSRRASIEKERPEKSERPRLFSRASNRDLEQLPEDSIAKGKGSRRVSTSSGSKSPSFLKRVSSTLSRKNKETASPDRSPSTSPLPSEPAPKTWLLTGWINVQLPDTMLWRRRCIKVDSHGWLFLSLSEDETASQTRRYHIPTEVRKIDLPDVDEQELPHSVRLTLQEGGMLQCACQNSGEQKEVLAVIRRCAASS